MLKIFHSLFARFLVLYTEYEQIKSPLRSKISKKIYGSIFHILPLLNKNYLSLKVHKNENFFDSDFGICVISLLVMSKY